MLDEDKHFSFPNNFPSDPGEHGRKTLSGIDSDGDGVRDDVQRWIYAIFPGNDTNSQKKRSALRQEARFHQYLLMNSSPDKDHGWSLLLKSVNCMNKTFSAAINPQDSWFYGVHLQAKVVNTYERITAYLSNDLTGNPREELLDKFDHPGYEPCDNQ